MIERALMLKDDEEKAAIATCQMRGWAEILHDALPSYEAPEDLDISKSKQKWGVVYRLTDAGWNSLHRTQGWLLATFVVSLLALAVGAFQFAADRWNISPTPGLSPKFPSPTAPKVSAQPAVPKPHAKSVRRN
jgi:hypothetical protein